VLGLALLRSRNKAPGTKECEESLQSLESAGDPAALLAARAAALEARLETGQSASALALFQQLEPSLSGYPESKWRILALVSAARPEYRDAARQALAALEHSWLAPLNQSYLKRPDIVRLSRLLFAQSGASSK
jgi:hypothetical protein